MTQKNLHAHSISFPDYTFTKTVKLKNTQHSASLLQFHLQREPFTQIIIFFTTKVKKQHPSCESTTQFSKQNRKALNVKWKWGTFLLGSVETARFRGSHGPHDLKVSQQPVKTDEMFWGPPQLESHNLSYRKQNDTHTRGVARFFNSLV